MHLLLSSNRKKRMRQLQKKIKTGTLNLKEDDPFELFVAATNIRYCYYNETHKILGNTYGMCVLQVMSVANISDWTQLSITHEIRVKMIYFF